MSEIAEQVALAEVKRRLILEFPEVGSAAVDAAVVEAYDRFRSAADPRFCSAVRLKV